MKKIRWKSKLAFVLACMMVLGAVPVTQANASEMEEGVSVSGNVIEEQPDGEESNKENQSGSIDDENIQDNQSDEKNQNQNSQENVVDEDKDSVNDMDNQSHEDKEEAEDKLESSYGVILMSDEGMEEPAITSAELYYMDGNECKPISPGQSFEQTKSLEIRVGATGAESVTVWFSTYSTDVSSENCQKGINLIYNQELGYYTGTLTLNEMSAAEWEVSCITANDSHVNYDYNGIRFRIVDEKGNTSVPTYDFTVIIYEGEGVYKEHPVKNVERHTSLQKMFPDGIPYTKKEGFEFFGWYLDLASDSRYISETDEFQVGDYSIYIYPDYTTREIDIDIRYQGQEDSSSWEEKTVIVNHNATYQDLYNALMNLEISHYNGMTFEQWNFAEFTDAELTNEIPRGMEEFYASAEYKEVLVSADIRYTTPEGDSVAESKKFLVDKNTTCEKLEELVNSWKIENHNKLGFKGWKILVNGEEKDSNEVLTTEYSTYVSISADYEKILLSLNVSYFSPEKNTKYEDMDVAVNRGSTYGDIISQVDFSGITHYSDVTLEGWKITDYYADKLDEEIEEYSGRVNISAEYEKNPFNVSYEYYDANYNIINVNDVFLFEKDVVTYNDILKELGLNEASSHAPEMGFTGWTERDLTEGMDTAVDRTWVNFVPQYAAENIVRVWYCYYDKQLQFHVYNKVIIYQDGDTYGDVRDEIVEKYLVSDDEHKAGFVGWFFYYQDENYNECSENDVITGKGRINCSPGYKTNGSPGSGNTGGSTDSGNTGGTGDFDNISGSVDSGSTGPNPTVTKPEETTEETAQETLPEIPRLTQETQVSEFPILSTEDNEEKTEAVKLEESVIAQKVEEARNAEEGTSLVIEMATEAGETATEIPVAVLETVKGKDVEIILDMGDYSWTINGKDIQAEELEAINLQVIIDSNAIDTSVVEEFANGEPTRQITLVHNGAFGFKATLTINVGSQYEGETGNLYYYNSDGELEFIDAGQIDADGNVNLDFSHASDYVVVVGRDRTEEETKKIEESMSAEIISEEVVPVEEEVETTGNGLILIVIVLIVVVAAVVIILVKKNKK